MPFAIFTAAINRSPNGVTFVFSKVTGTLSHRRPGCQSRGAQTM